MGLNVHISKPCSQILYKDVADKLYNTFCMIVHTVLLSFATFISMA